MLFKKANKKNMKTITKKGRKQKRKKQLKPNKNIKKKMKKNDSGWFISYFLLVGGGFRDGIQTVLTRQESVYFPAGFSQKNRYKSV